MRIDGVGTYEESDGDHVEEEEEEGVSEDCEE